MTFPTMTSDVTYLALRGPSALSAFRAARLLAKIRLIEPTALHVDARFIHFVHAHAPLQTEERARLDALLAYGDSAAETAAASSEFSSNPSFLIVPRLGTISPWASKATDIVHNTASR